MAEFIPVEPFDIVIFGATGDLSKRKLLPALFHRFLDGQIDKTSGIIGIARSEISLEEFKVFAKQACREATENWMESSWETFATLLEYSPMDATSVDADWDPLKAKLNQDGRPCVIYLATTPLIYVDICRALGSQGLNTPNTRLVLEKPIGTDLNSAQTINEGVGKVFSETAIYRIDHYLGKETVQNLLALRFSNVLFDPLWTRDHIDHVQITVAESLGLEGRADYYDRSGAVRDMVQNHMLQLVCLTAMEPPNALDADSVRTEKIKVLKALKPFTADTAKAASVRGQYITGIVEGQQAQGYIETLTRSQSNTETYVALKTEVENGRWAGVPFYLRTGKRMAQRKSEVVIQFKPSPHYMFTREAREPNRLVIRLQPDEGIHLFLQVKEPGPGGMRLKSLPLNLSYADNFSIRYPDAYERLLMDVVRGNLSLFMRRDEVETAWKWVDGLLQAWDKTQQPLEHYSAGSDGPMQAAMLLDRDSREWWGPS